MDQAPHMTVEHINKLNIKPDLRRALLHAHALAHDPTPSLIMHVSDHRMHGEIWHYEGPHIELYVNDRHSLMGNNFVFWKIHDRICAWHNWFDLNRYTNKNVMLHSVQIGHGDQNQYNKEIQLLLTRKLSVQS